MEQDDNKMPELPSAQPFHMTLIGASFGIGLLAQGFEQQWTHDDNLKYLNTNRVKRISQIMQALLVAAAELAQLAMEVDPHIHHDERN